MIEGEINDSIKKRNIFIYIPIYNKSVYSPLCLCYLFNYSWNINEKTNVVFIVNFLQPIVTIIFLFFFFGHKSHNDVFF